MLALAAHILNHASDDASRFGGQKLWHSFHKFINSIYSKFKLIFLVQKIVMPRITSLKYQTLEKYQVFFIPICKFEAETVMKIYIIYDFARVWVKQRIGGRM